MLGFELSLGKLRLQLVLYRLVVFFLEVVSECNARELGTCTSARDSQSSSQASARAFFGAILSIGASVLYKSRRWGACVVQKAQVVSKSGKGEVIDYDVGGEYFEAPYSPDPCSGNYTRSFHTTEQRYHREF